MTATTVEAGFTPDFEVAVIGAGFSGLGAAIRLKREGIEDFVVVERAPEVGGTWEINTYPGCRCDVPSNLYSYSFAMNPEWTQTYSPQREIYAYLRKCADESGVRDHLRLNTEVQAAEWDDDAAFWRFATSTGDFTARAVISGVGGLVEPSLPDIEGIRDFKGPVMHSARWNHDVDLKGKRVAVIGTGASAVQIVPAISKVVGHLDVYQRTAPWIMPHVNRRTSKWERRIYRAVPVAQRLKRLGSYVRHEALALPMVHAPRLLRFLDVLGNRHRAHQVRDSELRRKLQPDYHAGCKRLLPSNAYYPALQRKNVELVTDPIASITESGIRTADGERPIDVLVLATGFEVQTPPGVERIKGRGGRSIRDVWNDGGGIRAHLGSTLPAFPNMFMLLGPNTGLGHNSIIYMIESQLNYAMDGLRTLRQRDLDAVEVTEAAFDGSNAAIQSDSRGTIWTAGGCTSWYLDSSGRNTTIWPGFTFTFRRRTRKLDLSEYSLRPRVPAAPETGAEVPVPDHPAADPVKIGV